MLPEDSVRVWDYNILPLPSGAVTKIPVSTFGY